MTHISLEYRDISGVDRILGIKIVPTSQIARPGAVVDIEQRWLYVHPDEEHIVWASLGFMGEAFCKLNLSVERQINRHAKHAEEKLRVKTPGEIKNEVRDVLAGHRFLMQE
ncbi:hypothetical protein SEA_NECROPHOXINUS_85 [Microbacterium phage Necrophoxinus]|nr:hypothetical protein SEA_NECROPHOXINUS_85 [Microbacterium phage Necrophoxinus]